jgi:hypothetical protein
MPITHINRKEDKYYLHESTTKKGNIKYYFSKSSEGKMAERIPEGYEIYENPNAQVFLRKMLPRLISETEISIIEDSLKRNTRAKNYKIDVREALLTIYLPDQAEEELQSLGSRFPTDLALREMLIKNRTYTAVMRFRLTDKTKRAFVVERYYFRGEEGWMYLGSGEDLQSLGEKYCQHLGKDTFYELF